MPLIPDLTGSQAELQFSNFNFREKSKLSSTTHCIAELWLSLKRCPVLGVKDIPVQRTNSTLLNIWLLKCHICIQQSEIEAALPKKVSHLTDTKLSWPFNNRILLEHFYFQNIP